MQRSRCGELPRTPNGRYNGDALKCEREADHHAERATAGVHEKMGRKLGSHQMDAAHSVQLEPQHRETLCERALAAVTDDDQRRKTEQFYRGRNFDRRRICSRSPHVRRAARGAPPFHPPSG